MTFTVALDYILFTFPSTSTQYIGRYISLFKVQTPPALLIHSLLQCKKWSIDLSWQRPWYYYFLWTVPSFLRASLEVKLVKVRARKLNVVKVVGSVAPLHFDAVMGPSLTTCRATSLRTCSQTGTPLRPTQRAFRTTTLLSLPLQSRSPMALVLPTWTRTS